VLQKMVAAKKANSTRVNTQLRQTYDEFVAHRNSGQRTSFKPSLKQAPVVDRNGGFVVINATAQNNANALLRELQKLGLVNGSVFGRIVSGLLPIDAIPAAGQLAGLNRIRMALSSARAGAVTSQGDAAMKSDLARPAFGVDGSGIRVGVLSDSYDYAGTEGPIDQANGELPADIIVLEEGLGNDLIDEGRAMMQIVYDIAPGASQAFHSAWNGSASFANGIIELANLGCKVIVDDVFYLDEPFFQDGIIAQAVDIVASAGVSYHSAAGNSGRASYEAPFRKLSGGTLHDFDPGAGVDPLMHVTIPPFGAIFFVLQWADPAFSVSGPPGAASDVDVVLLNNSLDQILSAGLDYNVGGDPIEFLFYVNETDQPVEAHLLIDLFAGPKPTLLKWIEFGDPVYDEYFTSSSTVSGHSGARGAIAVGAAFFAETPVFGVNPPLLEPYSSAGPVRILFDLNGRRVLHERPYPQIVAPDGVETTFFYFDYFNDGVPDFFGTSAAAPHSAAVAALMWQLNPAATRAQIQAALMASCIDMGVPGFDPDSGAGFIQADAALDIIGGTYALGDVNLDGCIDKSDLQILNQAIQLRAIFDPALDINLDGQISVADARALTSLFTNPNGTPCPN
jgi:subtilisin family serine protease